MSRIVLTIFGLCARVPGYGRSPAIRKSDRSENLVRTNVFTKTLSNELGYLIESQPKKTFKKGDIVQCQVTAINKRNIDVTISTNDDRKNGLIHISEVANRYI